MEGVEKEKAQRKSNTRLEEVPASNSYLCYYRFSLLKWQGEADA
jgi:hypothetical protein